MGKLILLFCFAPTLSNFASGQTAYSYFEQRRLADSLMKISDFVGSAKYYQLCANDETFGTITEEFLTGYTLLLAGRTKDSGPWLNRAVDNGFGYQDTAYYLNKYRERRIFEKFKKSKRLSRVGPKLLNNSLNKMHPRLNDSALAKELTRREVLDQMYRQSKNVNDSAWKKQKKYDIDNEIWLRQIVSTAGWPGIARVGEEGSKKAWLILQHADLDTAFQTYCFPFIRRAYRLGDVSKVDYAYFIDRHLVNQGRPQLFGTQCIVKNPGDPEPQVEFKPIEDERNVDMRRKIMGMTDLDNYKQVFINWLKNKR